MNRELEELEPINNLKVMCNRIHKILLQYNSDESILGASLVLFSMLAGHSLSKEDSRELLNDLLDKYYKTLGDLKNK